jgi:hypothetical protein
MSTYHFKTVVASDGTVNLSDLPPHTEVEILVMEHPVQSEEVQTWLADLRARHPFAKMNKQEILEVLRYTRELVWVERHEN